MVMFGRNIFHNLTKFMATPSRRPPYGHVCQVGDPILREECVPIPVQDVTALHVKNHSAGRIKVLSQIIKVMKEVLTKYELVGISAPQIGVPYRILMVEVTKSFIEKAYSKDEKVARSLMMTQVPQTVIINPEMKVTNYSKIHQIEWCASIKGYSAIIPRYSKVNITGYCEEGKQLSLDADGYLARIIQHEMDHLDGKLYIDRMDPKTFQNDGWQDINKTGGKIYIHFDAEK